MGLFTKLFGGSKPRTEPLIVPQGAEPGDVIRLAIRSVIEQAGGKCAALEPAAEPEKWVQIMDFTLNCHYPHQQSPALLFS